MPTKIDYALMAAASYDTTRLDINKFPVPKDWAMSEKRSDAVTGFEAATFTKGTLWLSVL